MFIDNCKKNFQNINTLPTLDDNITSLENFICDTLLRTANVVCLGDFNINMFDYSSPGYKRLTDLMSSLQLQQLIDLPTRCTENSQTLIDLILKTADLEVVDHGLIDAHDISDHSAVFCIINCDVPKMKQKIICRRNLSAIPHREFDLAAESLPWNSICDISSLDDKVATITHYMTYLFDCFAPIHKIKVGRRPRWLSQSLINLIKRKNHAYKLAKRCKTPQAIANYKRLKNRCDTSFKIERNLYYNSLLDTSDAKTLWSNLRKVGVLPDTNKDLPPALSDPDEINTYYINSIPDMSPSPDTLNFFSSDTFDVTHDSKFDFTPINGYQLLQIMKNIKLTGAGVDGISGKMFFLCIPYCYEAMLNIINTSIIEGRFPTTWKIALVRPIPKTKNPQAPKDLRPISLLPFMSKILEKVCHAQMIHYLNEHKIIPTSQSGFRAGYSSTTSLLHLSNHV